MLQGRGSVSLPLQAWARGPVPPRPPPTAMPATRLRTIVLPGTHWLALVCLSST